MKKKTLIGYTLKSFDLGWWGFKDSVETAEHSPIWKEIPDVDVNFIKVCITVKEVKK